MMARCYCCLESNLYFSFTLSPFKKNRLLHRNCFYSHGVHALSIPKGNCLKLVFEANFFKRTNKIKVVKLATMT